MKILRGIIMTFFIVVATVLIFVFEGQTVVAMEAKSKNQKIVEQTIESVMTAIRELDFTMLNKYTDNYVRIYRNWIGIPKGIEYRLFSELQQPSLIKTKRYKKKYNKNREFAEEMVKHLDWKIKEVREQDEMAEIDLVVFNKDMSDVMGYYTVDCMEDMIAEEGTGISSFIKSLFDLAKYEDDRLLQYVKQADQDYETEITVMATKEKNGWKIHLSDEFINALMGNLNTEQFSDEVQDQLDELEKKYEEKMDQWGEDFEVKMDEWSENFEEKIGW